MPEALSNCILTEEFGGPPVLLRSSTSSHYRTSMSSVFEATFVTKRRL